MRIERRGEIEQLTPRVERFICEALGGVSLDCLLHAETRKADFKCLNGLLAIELKSLEEDAAGRMDNLTEELRERPDWPIFLGSAPMQAFLKHINEPDSVRRQIVDRIGRAIKNHMRKANKQLAAHESQFPRKNTSKVMMLVNEDHEIYTPDMVAHILHHLLHRQENGRPLYPDIDAVIYLSERHATIIRSLISFPVVCVEGPSLAEATWKRGVINHIVGTWADWNGVPQFHGDAIGESFSIIEHIPEEMSRQAKWELEYRRNPYMRHLTDDELRDRFDEIICVFELGMVKGSPVKPDQATMQQCLECMSHMMLEMGVRSVPITAFKFEIDRLCDAARRLNYPEHVVSWLLATARRDR